MIYISCRKNFDSADEWSPALLAQVGAQAAPLIGVSPVKLVQVHGYNCQALNVMDAYRANTVMANEAEDNCLPDCESAGFLWPGLGANYFQSFEFHNAQRHADVSAGYLSDFLKQFGAPVVITHSLGARVALEAARVHGAKMKALVLTGPAVDDDCLTKVYSEIQPLVNKILVFWSKKDPVLEKAYALDQFHAALGHDGPRTSLPWVESYDRTAVVDVHGAYRFDRFMWSKVAELL